MYIMFMHVGNIFKFKKYTHKYTFMCECVYVNFMYKQTSTAYIYIFTHIRYIYTSMHNTYINTCTFIHNTYIHTIYLYTHI